jgi:hypothetical protein
LNNTPASKSELADAAPDAPPAPGVDGRELGADDDAADGGPFFASGAAGFAPGFFRGGFGGIVLCGMVLV